MIKYNYSIRRNEGDEVKEYTPKLIPNELADIVYIQGPNSSGKSTLLNLIALGFFGEKLKEDELAPSLREKIVDLRYAKHQDIIFNIEIQNKKIGTVIKSTKDSYDSKDFKVVEIKNGKEQPISSTDFLKEYKIIYDIPTNPILRLPDLLKELKNSQETVENKIVDLRNSIDKIIKDIKEGNNPQRIKELEDDLVLLGDKHKITEKKIKIDEQKYLFFRQFHYLSSYLEYADSLKKIKIKIRKINTDESGLKTISSNLSKKQSELLYRMTSRVNVGANLIEDVIKLLNILIEKKHSNRLKILKAVDWSETLKNPDLHSELKLEIEFFLDYFNEVKVEDEKAINEANFTYELYTLLLKFEHENFSIPGIKMRIDVFIELLEKEILNNEGLVNRGKNISICVEKLNEILIMIDEAEHDFSELEEIKRKSRDASIMINNKTDSVSLSQLKKKKKTIEEKLNYYIRELEYINIDIQNADTILNSLRVDLRYKDLQKYSEIQLAEKVRLAETALIKDKESLGKIDKSILVAIEEKERTEQKEPHKYQKFLNEIESIRDIIFNLEIKFSKDFQENMKKIMTKGIKESQLTEAEVKYAEEVSKFLASKINFIRHIDKNYRIKKFNTVNQEIITESDKIIRFADLGTGQGQGAYLEGLISMNEDRKIIALFDEVAMMDSKTLSPIFEKLKELYNQKRLLLGIIVQRKDESVKVKSLVD